MRLHLIFMNVILANAASPDPCTALRSESRCVNGICIGLYWVDYEMTLFTLDSSLSMHRLLNNVRCSEAQRVVKQETVANSMHLNHKSLLNLFSELGALLRGLIFSVSRFPFVDEPAIEQMSRMFELIPREGGSSLERIIALELVENATGLVSSFVLLITTKAYSVSLLPMRGDVSILQAFAPYAAIATDLESVIHGGMELSLGIVSEIISRCPPLYKQQAEPIEPSISDLEKTELLESIIAAADVIHSLVVSGHGNLSPPDLGINRLLDLVRSTEDADLIHERLCPNVINIAEYSAAIHALDISPSIGTVNALIGLLVSLCFEHLSVADRIRVSTLFRGPRTLIPFAQSVFVLRPDSLEDASDSVLQSANVNMNGDLVISIAGSESVGYIGPRKQWISQAIERYLKPGGRYADMVWRYTDDSHRYVTLRSDDEILTNKPIIRAVGRVMGLALRYEVPIGMPLAKSVVKMLRLQPVSDAELASLLREEDPSFFHGTLMIGSIDWESPPESLRDLNFEGLLSNGERVRVDATNVDHYSRLTRQQKLFGSINGGIDFLKAGVMDTVGVGIFSMLSEHEVLERILPIPGGLNGELVFRGITFRNLDSSNPRHRELHQWIEGLLKSMTNEQLSLFNFFVTGAREPPFTSQTLPWIKLFFEPTLSSDSLPRSHTCHNELQMPLYDTEVILRTKLLMAIHDAVTIEGYDGYSTV